MRVYLNKKEAEVLKEALSHYRFAHCFYDSMEHEVINVILDRMRICEELQISESTRVVKSKRP